ncbi:MAG: GNAT family N-acetyltransferase [Spirosomataceae bacterium]|jgi:ribosomal protein S18 acetylase RimI-like enzyme
MDVKIRKGAKEDIPSAYNLVRELAIYERALEIMSNTPEKMARDLDNKLFEFIVAELDGKIVGMSLYYFRYSTWKGKRLYMEDIIVTESHRGNGIGKLLFEGTVAIAKESECTGMRWQVLDWNTSAVNFYRKYGTSFDDEWINCNLDF